MRNVRELRRIIYGVLIVLLAVDIAAVAVLFSPIGGRGTAKLQEAGRVRQEWQEELRKSLPVRDIDKKIGEAKDEVSEFYKSRIPARDSEIPIELGKVARENGVQLTNVRYAAADQATEGLRRILIDTSPAGDYMKVVKFINALERDKMFFIVDSISLAEQQGGSVRLDLRLETYLNEGAGE